MSDKGSGGGLLDELPIDRLRSEVTQLGKAVAKNGFSSVIEKMGDGTDGAAGKAVESVKKGESPVKAATKAGTSALKDKVKDAVGGGGGGKKMKVVNILETVDVPVPRRVAYDKWTQFQDIPDFTRKVEKVEQKEDEKVEWKAQIFLSHRTWQATIKEQVPDERIVWESSGEKGHVDGAVTFHELAPDLTRVLMTLEYHPQGFFEKTANLWRAQGRRARADMRQFRREMTHAHCARAGGAGGLARRDPRQRGRQERRGGPGRGQELRVVGRGLLAQEVVVQQTAVVGQQQVPQVDSQEVVFERRRLVGKHRQEVRRQEVEQQRLQDPEVRGEEVEQQQLPPPEVRGEEVEQQRLQRQEVDVEEGGSREEVDGQEDHERTYRQEVREQADGEEGVPELVVTPTSAPGSKARQGERRGRARTAAQRGRTIPPSGGGRPAAARLVHRLSPREQQGEHRRGALQEPLLHPQGAPQPR